MPYKRKVPEIFPADPANLIPVRADVPVLLPDIEIIAIGPPEILAIPFAYIVLIVDALDGAGIYAVKAVVAPEAAIFVII
jgi:hypothetical protein